MCLGMHVKIKVSRWIEIHHHRDCMVLFETVPDHCTIVVSIVFQDLIYTEFDRLSLKKNRPKTADGISSGKRYFIPSIPGSAAGEI